MVAGFGGIVTRGTVLRSSFFVLRSSFDSSELVAGFVLEFDPAEAGKQGRANCPNEPGFNMPQADELADDLCTVTRNEARDCAC